MLKINLLNILTEPLPNKCQQLNALLESSNIKDLYTYIEYIVNFVFANNQFKSSVNFFDIPTSNTDTSPSKLNARSLNIYQSNWPLKLVNRSQHTIDYDTIYNFLNTTSTFWLCLFKLDSYGAVFRIPASSFPPFIRTDSSYLSTKLDAYNCLNVTPIEYYFVYFLMFVHDNRSQSRKVFNEQTNSIELDSVYGDLLNDYLNFFLPVLKRNLEFPSFNIVQKNTFNPSSSSSSSSFVCNESKHFKQHAEHPSLFKRSLKKSAQLENDLTRKSVDPTIESTNDIKKIDTILRLINEILVFPFTDEWSSSSCRDSCHTLVSLETIFTLAMILRHSHSFSNAFSEYFLKQKEDDDSARNLNLSTTSQSSSSSSSSLAELRNLLFKIYWRKSFYKFFRFNLEHWPFEANIKWLIELWLIYVSPFKPCDFVKDNYLLIADIYELIIKRYSLVDLTNLDNLGLVHKILLLFTHNKDVIKKSDLKFSQFKSQMQCASKQEYQQLLRHNSEYRMLYNVFQEFDKAVSSFHGIVGVETIKLIGNFYESLASAKSLLNESQKKKSLQKASNVEWLKSLFREEANGAQAKMSDQDLANCVHRIDECLELIRSFYQNRPMFEEVSDIEQEVPSSLSSSGGVDVPCDYELTPEHGLKLTPKGRFKIMNGLARPKIETFYDPETAPIGDFENKFLVYFFRFVSDLMNDNFGTTIESMYTRADLIGNVSKKCFYKRSNECKAKVNLRSLASYKFIFYFLVYLLLLNLFTGYSIYVLIPFVLFTFFSYFILFN